MHARMHANIHRFDCLTVADSLMYESRLCRERFVSNMSRRYIECGVQKIDVIISQFNFLEIDDWKIVHLQYN